MTKQHTLFLVRLVAFLVLSVFATGTAEAQKMKMSSLVRQKMLEADVAKAKGASVPKRRMNAFVRATNADVLRENGCQILASFGDIHIANIPVNRLRSLARSESVLRIEAGRRCSALLDSASIAVHMPEVWGGLPTAPDAKWLGTGVVVGLMDIGFDLTHPMFYSADGQRYRVKAMWDQLDRKTTGSPVTGVDTTYVGRQYVGMEELLGVGHSYDGFIESHGTHTASTAAGGGAQFVPGVFDALQRSMPQEMDTRWFSGMAPDADICLVANATTNNADSIPDEMDDYYNTTLDALGFKYIFDYASAHGQPCVASFSEGSYPDLEGEDMLYGEVLNSMLGPGRILCAAAGNESFKRAYMSKPLGKAESSAFVELKAKYVYYTMRSSDKMTVRLTFYQEKGEPVVREYHTDQCYAPGDDDEILQDTLVLDGREHVVLMASYPSCYNEADYATEMLIRATDDGFVGWKIPIAVTLLGDTISSEIFGTGSAFTYNAKHPDMDDSEISHNIHTPGGLPGVICIGSTNTRNYFGSLKGTIQNVKYGDNGVHSLFSSIGPSMCGLTKPDVSAPGSIVVAAYSSFYHEAQSNAWDIATFQWNGREYLWSAGAGTSMSCPVAAGIIATWLQACPTLSPEDVMQTLAATSQRPADFYNYSIQPDKYGKDKNNYYGYGIIDAKAGLEYVLQNFTGISNVTEDSHSAGITYDLMGRPATSLRPGHIYIRNGKKIIVRQ